MIDNIRFSWDDVRAEENGRKHGISFDTAINVFADPFHITQQDQIEGNEYRWQTVGFVEASSCYLSPIHGSMMRVLNMSVSFRQGQRPRMKEGNIKMAIVEHKFDPTNPPPLTDAQRQELARLATLRDEDIDTSDSPEVLDWSNAARGKFYRPVKKQVTLRLDADLIEWFKAKQGGARGYQTAINAALRKTVEGERRKAG
ncbi:MAG: hypothetical protein RL367_1802 [Pseudomonadota bacterium]